jgi:hypothetical protein
VIIYVPQRRCALELTAAVTATLLITQGVYDAIAHPNDPVLSKGYTPNVFNYRPGAVDKKYPFVANADGAVIIAPYRTGVSTAQAKLYRDTLFFSVSVVTLTILLTAT